MGSGDSRPPSSCVVAHRGERIISTSWRSLVRAQLRPSVPEAALRSGFRFQCRSATALERGRGLTMKVTMSMSGDGLRARLQTVPPEARAAQEFLPQIHLEADPTLHALCARRARGRGLGPAAEPGREPRSARGDQAQGRRTTAGSRASDQAPTSPAAISPGIAGTPNRPSYVARATDATRSVIAGPARIRIAIRTCRGPRIRPASASTAPSSISTHERERSAAGRPESVRSPR